MDEAPKTQPKLDLLTRTPFFDGQRMTLHGVVLEVIEVQPTRIVLATNDDPIVVERFAEQDARWRESDKRINAAAAEMVGQFVANMRTRKLDQKAGDEPAASDSE